MSLRRGGTKKREDGMLSMGSPIDEGSSSGGVSSIGCGEGVVLKKGPWTSAEDMILVEYVKKHGEGNWNAVQKYSGLSRCGKSCRLRWANHLRPNLRKGAFTPEEERLIIELHAKMGNKWARMAAHLPGRTDNEIKNYWNTRIKRRQRAGLPLYPPELCAQPFQDNQQNQIDDLVHTGDEGNSNLLQRNGYNTPDTFGSSHTNQRILPYIPPFPDFAASSLLMKGIGSPQLYSYMTPTRSSQKRPREPQQPLSAYGGDIGNDRCHFGSDWERNCRSKGSQSFDLGFPYCPDTVNMQSLSFDVNGGSQSLLNSNFSASKPTSAVKLELPSFQYPENTFDSSSSHPSLPAFESVDSLIQSPPPGSLQSECSSPRSSGLLDALLYEANALSRSKNPSSERSSNSSTFTPGYATEHSPLNMCSKECEEYGNPNSPLGNSSSPVFNELTQINSTKSSLEEKTSSEVFSGSKVKPEPVDHIWSLDREEKETHLDFSRPDALLDSCWLGQSTSFVERHCILNDAIAALFGDDLRNDFKNTTSGSNAALSTGFASGSRSWKNMPPVCQMSELR